jgi:TonB dependent receptor
MLQHAVSNRGLGEALVIILLVLGSVGWLNAAATDDSLNPPVIQTGDRAIKQPVLSEDMPTTKMDAVVVIGKLNDAQNQIAPSLGATTYMIDSSQIESAPQGDNAPFNHVMLRLPGVSQDSSASGSLHVRDEHANVQYRINDTLIPEGVTGFSTEFDSRFIDRFSLITGALPAQFGFRTAGIIDIHTKDGGLEPGGDVSLYGGSYQTARPSFEYGGHEGNLSYFYSGSYLQSDLGIENPTSSQSPIHDNTNQLRGFTYLSYVIDDTSRVSLIFSGATNHFQIPNNPGQQEGSDLAGNMLMINNVPSFDSSTLDETQNEQNYFAVMAYQKSIGELNLQLSAFGRYSNVLFRPDMAGDLFFNGLAGRVDKNLIAEGTELDASYKLCDSHTLRFGYFVNVESANEHDATTVFPTDAMGNQTGFDPFTIYSDSLNSAYFYGLYLQDEWKITDAWTVNFGARADMYNGLVHENQLSPRINTTYEIDKATKIHAGYARYFTPPPLESVATGTVTQFANTTGAPANFINDPPRTERADYFDAGVTREFLPGFQLGLDGFYKTAKNQLDDGQFGAAPILSAFNYRKGEIYGTELTGTYNKNGWQAYGNFAWDHATGRDIGSSQFRFGQDELDFIHSHDIFLDHDQRFTATAGASYLVNETRPYIEVIYGRGLRNGFANTGELPGYVTFNLGVEQGFKFAGMPNLKVRIDIINLFDQIYELRDGSGIGVGAPQYGERRAFEGGITYSF